MCNACYDRGGCSALSSIPSWIGFNECVRNKVEEGAQFVQWCIPETVSAPGK
jgi:hypothetical protein